MHRRQPLPRFWMMTDERQGEGLFPALERLPRGGGVVFRHYSLPDPERRCLFEEVTGAARRRGLLLMLGGEPELAATWGAEGSHGLCVGLPSAPGLLRSAPVHRLEELRAAEAVGAAFVFVSPVFPTRSHPDAAALGPQGFAAIAGQARVPVIALGGMNETKARSLSGLGMYGWAGIDAWAPEPD
jgi:thiamine-phosphate pyrophosphorylase